MFMNSLVNIDFSFKAAGLATMISTMRPDIDNIDEYVRNTTARYAAVRVICFCFDIYTISEFLLTASRFDIE